MARKAADTADVKPRSYRIDDETQKNFEELTKKYFGSKNECLKSLIQLYELEESKKTLPGFTADIDNFRMHLSVIEESYLHILQMNADAEQRVGEKYALEITSMKKTISSLQASLEKSSSDVTNYKELYREQKNLADNRLDALSKSQASLYDKDKMIKMFEAQVSELTQELTAVKEQLAANSERLSQIDTLEVENEQLKAKNAQMDAQLTNYEEQLEAEKKASAAAVEKTSSDAAATLKKALQEAAFETEKAIFALNTKHQEEINTLKEQHLAQMQELIQKYSQVQQIVQAPAQEDASTKEPSKGASEGVKVKKTPIDKQGK